MRKSAIVRENEALRASNARMMHDLGQLNAAIERRRFAHLELLDNLLVLDPSLDRFRTGTGKYRGWDYDGVRKAAKEAAA